MEELKQQFNDHEKKDEQRFSETLGEIRFLRENHVAHIERDVSDVKDLFSNSRIAQTKTSSDIEWIKWFLSAVVLTLLYLVIKK